MVNMCEFREDWQGCMVDVREQAVVVRELLGAKNDEYRASMRRWRERSNEVKEERDAEGVGLEGTSGKERQDVDGGDGDMTNKGDQDHKEEDLDEDMTEGLWVAI